MADDERKLYGGYLEDSRERPRGYYRKPKEKPEKKKPSAWETIAKNIQSVMDAKKKRKNQ